MAINVKDKLVTLESLGVAYSAEQDAREEADQALSTRIDNIVAPEGDPSLTEVSDARVSGSTTYNTLKARLDADKAAIGTEISQLSADLDTQVADINESLSAEIDTLKLAMLPFVEHLIGTFDDGNGGKYTDTLIAVLESAIPEPIVNMVKSENLIGTSAQLFTDEGTTEQVSLKTSGSRYYYLDTPADEDCTYKVTITITPDLNSFMYKAVYVYNGEILTGKGTATPTAYNLTSTKEGGIISVVSPNPQLTEDYVFETQVEVKANRNLAIMFYRDYDSCIGSVTAQKVV